jgi:hypothetical protein
MAGSEGGKALELHFSAPLRACLPSVLQRPLCEPALDQRPHDCGINTLRIQALGELERGMSIRLTSCQVHVQDDVYCTDRCTPCCCPQGFL